MKRLSMITLVSAVLLSGACDTEVEDLADVEFETTIVKTIPVTVTNTTEMTSTVTFDATADSEVLKYKDKIKSYEITSLAFAIENYSTAIASEIYFNGVFGFSKITENAPVETCGISPLSITHVAGTGDFTINPCTALANELAAMFLADNAVKIYLKGSYTQAPVNFDFRVTAKVKITANPF